MGRLFNARQRMIIALRAGGNCEKCGVKLTKSNYHADHIIPWSRGGKTLTNNGAALCATCNMKKGTNMKDTVREWQTAALKGATKSYIEGERNFVINAAPGAGKTYAAGLIAQHLIEQNMIDRVIVIAPRKKIVTQWTKMFSKMTGRNMMTLTGKYFAAIDPKRMSQDVAATWSGIKGMADALQAICQAQRVLVVADEVHHAALGAVWGDGTHNALVEAKYVLALTGTPTRGDGKTPIWLGKEQSVRPENIIDVSYETAIEKKWCVPATLHRHAGCVSVAIDDAIVECRETGTVIPREMEDKMTPQIRSKLRFDRVIKQPLYEADGKTPQAESFHTTMIDYAAEKLEDLRSRPHGEFGLPNAGALVIAPSIEMAVYFRDIIEKKWPEEEVTLVHSGLGGAAEQLIDAFASSDNKWIVSVNMVSEGVDIPRLRVMVFLPSGGTELFFRQAVGRVIRKDDKIDGKKVNPEKDKSRAYIVMPDVSQDLTGQDSFVEYARRLEKDMGNVPPPPVPQCPQCGEEGHRPTASKPCSKCEYAPPPEPQVTWTCSSWAKDGCGAINMNGSSCHECGLPRSRPLTYAEAIGQRNGIISRQIESTEEEVQKVEEVSDEFYEAAQADPRLARVIAMMTIENVGVVGKLWDDIKMRKGQRT